MATIKQLPSGKWCAEIRRTGLYKSKSFLNRKDALRWGRQTEVKVERNELDGSYVLNETTFGDLLKRYMKEVTCHKKSAQVETYRINQLLRTTFTQEKLSQFTAQTIAIYRDQRLRTVKPETINRELVVVSHCLTVARTEWGYPLPLIAIPKAKGRMNERNRRLEGDEEIRLFNHLKKQTHKAAVILALETAMRQGEIGGLTWKDVHLKKRIVHLSTTKNGEVRSVPLSSLAIKTLQDLPRRIDGSVLGFQCSHSITNVFRRARTRAGIKDLRFHDLRHEATSRLFEKGLNIMEVATITGHKDLRMLRRYTHLRAEDLAKKLG